MQQQILQHHQASSGQQLLGTMEASILAIIALLRAILVRNTPSTGFLLAIGAYLVSAEPSITASTLQSLLRIAKLEVRHFVHPDSQHKNSFVVTQDNLL